MAANPWAADRKARDWLPKGRIIMTRNSPLITINLASPDHGIYPNPSAFIERSNITHISEFLVYKLTGQAISQHWLMQSM
jgi:hypothetical protein